MKTFLIGRSSTAAFRLAHHCLALCVLLLALPSYAAVDPEQIRPSMVRIFALNAERELVSSGSGFVVTAQGHVLTNRHVIKDARHIQVALAGNDKALWDATVLEQSAALDFALLQAPQLAPSQPVTLSLVTSRQSERVYALGFPGASDNLMARMSLEPTYTEGIISKLERANSAAGPRLLIQHTADLALGNSGGPLLNQCNQVIGTNTLIAKAYEQGPVAPGFYGAVAISEVVERLRPLGIALQIEQIPCASGSPAATALPAAAPLAPAAEPPVAASSERSWLRLLAGGLLAGLMLVLVLLGYRQTRKKTPAIEGIRPETALTGETATSEADWHPQPDAATRPAGHPILAHLEISYPQGRQVRVELEAADFSNGGEGLVLGRDPEVSDVQIPDDSVSRRQLRLQCGAAGFSVEDLNSTNGTDLNGRRLNPLQPYPLRHGDRLQIGDVQLSFISRLQQ